MNAMDDLFGVTPAGGASASPMVQGLTSPAVPANWQSPAVHGLTVQQGRIDAARNGFIAVDDTTKTDLDQTDTVVRDGKTGMRDIKDDYRLNRARLSGSPSPEVSAKLTELDAVRTQDGANTVRGTQAALPSLGGAQGLMNAPMQAMPAAMAPMQAMPAMMGAPMAAFGPLTSALSGLTIPQQVTHNLGEEGSGLDSGGSGVALGPGSESGQRIAEIALKRLRTPYVWGGGNINGPTGGGFDCSGLAQYAVYQATGIELPRVTTQQIHMGINVPPSQAQPGDLVFSEFQGGAPGHVQIALGGGRVVHAPQTGDVVRVANMPANCVVKRIA